MKYQIENSERILMTDGREKSPLKATITDIQWERILMHITIKMEYGKDFDHEKPLDFYLVAAFYKTNGKFVSEKIDDNTYRITMNITNPGYCLCIPTGTYGIFVCQGGRILSRPEIAPELAPVMMDKCRTFIHNGKSKAYIVNISLADNTETLTPEITIRDMSNTGLRVFNEDDRPEEKPSLGKTLHKKWVSSGRKFMQWDYNVLNRFYHLTPAEKRKKNILFMSEQNLKLGSNLTSVMDRLEARNMLGDYNIETSARATVAIPHYGIKSWLSVLRKMAWADQIFIDDQCPILDWVYLNRNNTELIQLWHAGAGFKSSGYSRWGHIGCPAPMGCHRQYKYGIAGSRHIAHFFSEVFGINTEQILPTGMPRMDEFLDPEYRKTTEKKLRAEFPFTEGKKVILFAPTYRGTNRFTATYPYELIDFDHLYELCGDDTVVLFKMHPWVEEPVPIPEKYRDRFADVNKYPNINDLFYITDLLITDYSSNIFEFSLMRKPMLFFAFDEIQYSFSRGFHRDYEESAPGKICHTFDEVLDAIKNKDFCFEKVEEYVELHFDHIDSEASDRVIDWIILGNLPEDIKENLRDIDLENDLLKRLDFTCLENTGDF